MIIKIVETEKELHDAYNVRKEVFVVEQHVPLELEIDELEDQAVHFIAYDESLPIGAGRLRRTEKGAKVERICVKKAYRDKGIGRILMQEIEKKAKESAWTPLLLNAQTQAEPFYKNLGYETYSDVFLEAEIPHVAMKKENL